MRHRANYAKILFVLYSVAACGVGKSIEPGPANEEFKPVRGRFILSDELLNQLAVSAEAGDRASMSRLFYHFRTTQNDSMANYWMRRAAETGYSEEQFSLGTELVTLNPSNTTKYREGVFWLRESADQGNVDAIHALEELKIPRRSCEPIR